MFCYLAERLLDVWLETNGVKYREVPYVLLNKRSIVLRVAHFLKQKLEGREQGTGNRKQE